MQELVERGKRKLIVGRTAGIKDGGYSGNAPFLFVNRLKKNALICISLKFIVKIFIIILLNITCQYFFNHLN